MVSAGEPVAAALTSTSTSEQNVKQAAIPTADSVNRILYIQTTQHNINGPTPAESSNPIENSSSSGSSRISGSNSSSEKSGETNGKESVTISESSTSGDTVYNQNYDEQSDSSYSAWDPDDLFDDDEDEEYDGHDRDLGADDQNSQNDEFDDEYEDEYDVDPKARQPDSDQSGQSSLKIAGADDLFRNDDTEASSAMFGSRRKISTKLGSNDAIKFVETPHGKAGFVYQAPAPTSSNADNKDETVHKKKGDSSLQNSSIDVKQRITPVLTADGKVALLYRGAVDSGSTGKYEPIRNFTNFEENKSVDVVSTTVASTTVVEVTVSHTTTTTTSTTTVATRLEAIPDNTEENAILPNINRPLSEVLGIKKNQFTQFRIRDLVPSVTPSLNDNDHTSNRIPDLEQNHRDSDEERSQIMTPPRTADEVDAEEDDSDSTSFADVFAKTDVVNLAIIPAFDSDLAAIQEHEDRRAAEEAAMNNGDNSRGHYRSRQNHRRNMEDLSAIHCAMQAMVAIAAMATVFGMLGAYFKTRVLDQITIMHWWEMVGVRYWVGFSRRGGVIL